MRTNRRRYDKDPLKRFRIETLYARNASVLDRKPRLRDVVERVYGFGRPAETHKAIATDYGLSMERIIQLRREAEWRLEKVENTPVSSEPFLSWIRVADYRKQLADVLRSALTL